MGNYRCKLGKTGEKKAGAYLKRQGYQILEYNFRTRNGEIDIIAKDGDCLVFTEVKTRTNTRYGAPAEAVSYFKQRHLWKAAQYYMMRYDTELECRFDVIEVLVLQRGLFQTTKINHYKNIMQ